MSALSSTELKRLHRSWRKQPLPRLALILDGVASPFNVGGLVRTAAAYRVDAVWTAPPTPRLDDPKVGRTAMGTERYLEWSEAPDGPTAVGRAHSAGYEVVGVELAHEALPVHEADLDGDVCLALGHEDRGLAAATLSACDRVIYLPQLGRVGSLNVGTAGAMAIWEVRRRALSR
jgi:tRNA (guanosine-2'-O-)-methyltransferase